MKHFVFLFFSISLIVSINSCKKAEDFTYAKTVEELTLRYNLEKSSSGTFKSDSISLTSIEDIERYILKMQKLLESAQIVTENLQLPQNDIYESSGIPVNRKYPYKVKRKVALSNSSSNRTGPVWVTDYAHKTQWATSLMGYVTLTLAHRYCTGNNKFKEDGHSSVYSVSGNPLLNVQSENIVERISETTLRNNQKVRYGFGIPNTQLIVWGD
jgi:hypothetical protein